MNTRSAISLAGVADAITDFCYSALADLGITVEDDQVSVSKIVEVVNFAERDLKRLAHDLDDKISREKFSAYHAFWFAKLGPISGVKRPGERGKEGAEIVDINERLAVLLAAEWMLIGVCEEGDEDIQPYSPAKAKEVGYSEPPAPLVWRNCKRKCAGVCFKSGMSSYLRYNDFQNFEYLVKSLRYRPTGPYGIVNFLEATVINSCRWIQENPDQALA